MDPSKGRIKACFKQCRLAQFALGRPSCISRDENSPGCPCESFSDCYFGLHMDESTSMLWKYYDIHDYFPDWEDYYLDLSTE